MLHAEEMVCCFSGRERLGIFESSGVSSLKMGHGYPSSSKQNIHIPRNVMPCYDELLLRVPLTMGISAKPTNSTGSINTTPEHPVENNFCFCCLLHLLAAWLYPAAYKFLSFRYAPCISLHANPPIKDVPQRKTESVFLFQD